MVVFPILGGAPVYYYALLNLQGTIAQSCNEPKTALKLFLITNLLCGQQETEVCFLMIC